MPDNAKHVLDKLRGLTGRWQDQNSTATVEFRESANRSVVVETWCWPDQDIEAITIYFRDQTHLVATHYCPLGNQPTLKLTPGELPDRLEFRFSSATNLQNRGDEHCDSFWYELLDADRFTRSETYTTSGVQDSNQRTFHRVKP